MGHNSLRFEIVTRHEQLVEALAVRAIAFMEEGLAARQAFDGNDYQCTHVLAYLADEPIASVRIRWFNAFAKIERFGFRPSQRNLANIKAFADFIFSHIARKGYSKAITHAEPKFASLWIRRLGFTNTGKEAAQFATLPEPYLELVKEIDPIDGAVTAEAPISVLFRIEGQWDRNSPLE